MRNENEKLVNELIRMLKRDDELANVSYNHDSNMVVIGINPSKIKPGCLDEEQLAEFANSKVRGVGETIARKSNTKYFDRLIYAEALMFAFEPRFVQRNGLTDIADECWSHENPVYGS